MTTRPPPPEVQGNGPEPGLSREWRTRVWALAASAVLLRLLLFLGRGDYMAFDEGWYLLLGRSLFMGEGYTLVGIPHITLSPLFPLLAGAAGSVLGSWLWGGRVVAAVFSGLLVLPAWAMFRRLAPERTAFVALLFVATLPTLAPFVAPYFIGADLWVGAEPLLHFFLFLGIALWLRARDTGSLVIWFLAGGAFGLGFLARPEAIITWGLLGLTALTLSALRRSTRILQGAALMGLGFLLPASPYWIHIHQVTGQWSLTGRGVSAASNAVRMVTAEGRGGPSSTIEEMLWQDDDTYIQRLYGLDETGLRLRSRYWGVYPEEDVHRSGSPPGPEDPAQDPSAEAPGSTETGPEPPPSARVSREDPAGEGGRSPPSFQDLFLTTMGAIFPPILWPLALLGLLGPGRGRTPRLEIPVVLALLGTSLAIAVLVAVDPRTQLFLVPLLALYLARGIQVLDELSAPHLRRRIPRTGFLRNLLTAVIVLGLLGVSLTRLYLGLAYGSPHHLVAQQNRMVAEELDTFFQAPEGPVASWHPAMAIYADRDWRVLPYADLPRIIRYSQASGARVMVLSGYYPPFRGETILGTRYLVLPVPDASVPEEGGWVLTPVRGDTIRGLGRLDPEG